MDKLIGQCEEEMRNSEELQLFRNVHHSNVWDDLRTLLGGVVVFSVPYFKNRNTLRN